MYLPSDLFELPYRQLVKARHAASPPVLLLVALEPDALCACRILVAILKRDYIQHTIVPVAGYGDLERAGATQVQPMRMQNGGVGGHIICLGTGGMVDLAGILGLEPTVPGEDGMGGVEVWVIDARRPWNLSNVFGGRPADSALIDISGNARGKTREIDNGKIQHNFRPGRGGVIVFDDGDISQLEREQEAYFELERMPEVDDDGHESDGSESGSDDDDDDSDPRAGQKRKSWSGAEDEDEDEDADDRPRQRRRSNSQESIPITPTRNRQFTSSSDTLIPNSQPSPAASTTSTIAPPSAQEGVDRVPSLRRMRRRLIRSKRAHEQVLHAYYSRGSTYSEPISSLMYRMASELGHANNDSLWLACVGVQSIEQYGRLSSVPSTAEHSTLSRDELVLSILRDEVNRLNPPDAYDSVPELNNDPDYLAIPTHAKSPTDTSIQLSPEPRLLLIRHWSLYESMLHSPYLSARLHLWSEPGKKRMHKLLAKMGVSLASAKQGYVHMNVDAKRQLRSKLLKYAPVYGLEGLLPPAGSASGKSGWGFVRSWGWKACLSANDVGTILGAMLEVGQGRFRRAVRKSTAEVSENGLVLEDVDGRLEGEEFVTRFWAAYDALGDVSKLLDALPLTIGLHKAILRTGASLLAKRQIRHLRAFRMGVVKEGPDVSTFTHPGALTKLALWLAEAIQEQEKDAGRGGVGKKRTPLVLASLNETRGVYVVVGTGGGGGATDMEERRLRRERLDAKKKHKDEKASERQRRKEENSLAKAQKQAEREANGEHADEDDLDEIDTESEASDDEEEDRDEDTELDGLKTRSNRFGVAFQEVVDEVGATTRIDNFENCVIEVKKEDLSGFLEALSMKAVIG